MPSYQAAYGTPSSTIVTYASGFLDNPFEEYFFCRVTNNNSSDYVLILDPVLGTGSVTGSSYYYFSQNINSNSWSFHEESITISGIEGKYCYSSEDPYPAFVENNFPVGLAILSMLAIWFLMDFLRQFMLALMNKVHRGGTLHAKKDT